jgi:hypothetical protein
LSIEITTGMSAPPIGMMISTPNSMAVNVIAQNKSGSPPDRQNR